MSTLWLILSLIACNKPTTTGPTSMIGVLHNDDGTPAKGVAIHTLEAQTVTDDEGKFAVTYKEPSQWVQVEPGDIVLRRKWSAADNDQTVDITLPALSLVPVGCSLPAPADLRVRWNLGPHTTAESRFHCDKNEPVTLNLIEGRLPDEVEHVADPAMAITIEETPQGWNVKPPPITLDIELIVNKRPLPSACVVRANGEVIPRHDGGIYRAKLFGDVEVEAQCDGIPATPAKLFAVGDAKYEMPWFRETPILDVSTLAPWAIRVTVAKLKGRTYGWSLELPVPKDGRVVLPRLDPGEYAIGVNQPPRKVGSVTRAKDIDAGTLWFVALPEENWDGETPEGVGILTLEQDLRWGELPVAPMPM